MMARHAMIPRIGRGNTNNEDDMKHPCFALLLLSLISTVSFAQFTEDAVRYSSRGTGAGARPLAMGNAYIGVSDDFSASLWNPAGLAQMRRLELMGGISSYNLANKSSFFGTTSDASASATAMDNVGFVFPFPTVQGSLVVSFGYHRIADYALSTTFDGFNDRSSIIASLYDASAGYDIPYNVYLTNSAGYTAVQKNVQQTGTMKETGSLGAWTFAGAVDIEENISFGASLNVYSGVYDLTRNYMEADTRNLYVNTAANLPADSAYLRFNKFYYDSYVNAELTGSNLTVGLMYRTDFFRVGLVAKGPSSLRVEEKYSNEGESVFDATGSFASQPKTKHSYEVPNDSVAPNTYGIQTPWTLGVGASLFIIPEWLISLDLEQTDWTQMAWSDNPTLEKRNVKMQAGFRTAYTVRAGTELDIPGTELRLRSGFSYEQSPYKNDAASYDKTIVSGGFGYFLQRNVMVDGAVAFGNTETFRNQYNIPGLTDPSRTDEKRSATIVTVTLSYRF